MPQHLIPLVNYVGPDGRLNTLYPLLRETIAATNQEIAKAIAEAHALGTSVDLRIVDNRTMLAVTRGRVDGRVQ